MKITVSRSLLSDALRKVQGLAGGKNSMPILSNVKIEAKDQKMTFMTTDLDISVVCEITCNVVEEGAITLPAKLLSDAIARAPEGDVSLEVSNEKSIVRAGSSVFKIVGLPANEFPVLPTPEGEEVDFVIPQEVMKSLIRRTAYAMCQDETRRILRGLHIKFEEGFLTCVATDGRRMAIAEYKPEEPYQFSLNFTLPAKTVAEMNKNIGSSGNIIFRKCASQIEAKYDNGIIIYSKIIDDAYPNYAQVIPKGNDNIITIDRALLVSAIERVGVFAEAQSMKFDFSNGELKLQSSTESGNGEEAVPAKYDGEAINATFNHDYILDALKSIDDDEVKFAFSDGSRPVIITCSMPGLALVMPLRIS